MSCIVCKFGGSSVTTSGKLQQIVTILRMDPRRRCFVLSAPGKGPDCPVKVTDTLIAIVNKSLLRKNCSAEIRELKERFHAIYDPLKVPAARIDEILADLDRRRRTSIAHPGKYRDLMVAAGEDLNCQLFAEYLKTVGIDAVYRSPKDAGLLVTPNFGDAQPLPEAARHLSKLKKLCEEKIVVFPGFFGFTAEGDVATFSRGGSDLTGSLLAEALDAIEYENWTDVDGIFSAHPTMVKNPELIPALTYKEMRELSYVGFNVLHEEAVKPVLRKKIPIRLRNTMNTANPGTLIVSERLPSERDVVGIASGGGYCSFTLEKFLMNREKGFGRRLLSIFEELDLSYEHCPSGVDSISVILDQSQLKLEMANTVIRAIEEELKPDEIRTEFGIALVAVVGEGLIHKIGVLAAAATALSKTGVNIKIANQGSSEISMIFGIDVDEEGKAVNALYDEFFRK
ncbi:MAG: aspartate kinase [Chitinispirillaceae bacterium]|nr:aspartate kinase [Chitinispirillaceae bacterium]